MGLTKFESEIKTIMHPQAEAYARFADLNNFALVKERLSDPAAQEQIAQHVPADKMAELKQYADALSFDADAIHISSPMGDITLRIVEREEPKCIKLASEGSPVPLYVWIQLLPATDTTAKMRITVGAEVNFFLKGMVSKPLQQAADGLANILCAF